MLSRFTIRRYAPAWRLAGLVMLLSCASTVVPAGRSTGELPLETLWEGIQSRYAASRSMALYISDPAQLEKELGGMVDRTSAEMIRLHRMDWRREAMLCLFMGGRRSGGYGLGLAEPAAMVSDGVAVIRILWREPAPGAIVTQQLTSPGLVLKVPKGDYDRIEIRDQTGRGRFRLVAVDD